MTRHVGTVYQAESGQWSWVILGDGEELVRGGGYASEDDAFDDMYSELEACLLLNPESVDTGQIG